MGQPGYCRWGKEESWPCGHRQWEWGRREQSQGRQMGRAEWETGEAGEMAFEEEAELSQRLGGQAGGGQEKRRRGGGRRGLHGNKSVSEKSGFQGASLFIIIIRIILSARGHWGV